MSFEQRIDRLGREVDDFRIEYEKFLNGARPTPPEELRTAILAGLRRLRGASLKAVADNFRIAQLEARFNSYNELYNRRSRELEEGRVRGRTQEPGGRGYDARAGIVVGDRVEPEAVEALYRGLVQGPGGDPRFDLDSFRVYLMRQAEAIRSRTGCEQIQFRLAAEEGRMKLKAKPITGPTAPAQSRSTP